MESIFFWKNWESKEKAIYSVAFVVFFLSFGLLIYQYSIGDSKFIGWTTEVDIESVSYYVDNVSNNFHVFPSEAYSYLNFIKFVGDDIKPAIFESKIAVVFIFFAIILIATSLNGVQKLWYFLGALFIILLFANFKFDLLQIITSENALLAYVVTAVIGLSYYYQAFNKNIDFGIRFLSFFLVISILGIIIYYFSGVTSPTLYLFNYGILGLLIITVVFIIATGTEIVEFFLFVCTDAEDATKRLGLPQFILFSVAYILIFGFILLKNTGVLVIEMYYPEPIYFYFVASIFGIWGFKKRSFLLNNYFTFQQGTAYLYLALGIIANVTLGYFYFTGNDPVIELFRNLITVVYLSFGLVYFIYVIVNYMPLFKFKARIYLIVNEPTRFSYGSMIVFGLLNLMVLQFQDRFSSIEKGLAGYYNGLGDIYYAEKNDLLAEQYYNYGNTYDYYNHKSNYSLGCMARTKQLVGVSVNYFETAIKRRPTAYAYANIGEQNLKKDQFFESMFALREGLGVFKENYQIYNNMALIFSKTNIDDSTVYYLQKSKEFAGKDLNPIANEIAFFAKNSYPYPDSLEYSNSNPNVVYLNNAYAYKTARKEEYIQEFDPQYGKDTILNLATFGYLFNYGFNHIKHIDTTMIKRIEKLLTIPYNESYYEDLRFLLANAYYYNGRPQDAKIIMDDLSIFSPQNKGFYSNQLGVWSIENNHYENAVAYFETALRHLYLPSKDHYAIMLSEIGRKNDAITILNELKTTESKDLAERKLEILQLKDFSEAISWEDDKKLELIHLRISEMNETNLKALISSIKSPAIDVLVAAELINFYRKNNLFETANTLYEGFKIKSGVTSFEIGELNYQYLKLLAENKKWDLLSQNKALFLNNNREKERCYFEALAFYGAKDIKNAKVKFTEMMQKNLAIADGIAYMAELEENPDTKYNLLLTGIRIQPNATILQKAYIMQCLEMKRSSFADDTWIRFKNQVSVAEFNEFALIFNKRQAEIEAMFN